MSLTNNSELDKKLLSLGWTKQQLDMYLDELYIHRSASRLVEDYLHSATPEIIRSDADACGVFDDHEN
jgi:hypothetical protein